MEQVDQSMKRVCYSVLFKALLLLVAVRLEAAPFAREVNFTQPDGSAITLWGEGNSFWAVFETLDGYTVVFDENLGGYCYARLSEDGEALISTGVAVGSAAVPRGLQKHLRPSEEHIRSVAGARRATWYEETGLADRWLRQKGIMRSLRRQREAGGHIAYAPPSFTTIGQKMGLTLLIDFASEPATIPKEEIEQFFNSDNYSGFGNNGSVKEYFYENSNGMLVYSNTVTAYIRMQQPRSYYMDVNKDAGRQGNFLIRDAIAIMKQWPEYNSEVVPLFDNLTVENNRVVALNVYYTGDDGGVWSKGLWPHNWVLAEVGAQQLAPGISVYNYQITNIGNDLELGTFCHENGHLLCGYPDLYDYTYNSSGGAGMFCLMNSGGHGKNPVQICAYLKYASGWCDVIEVDNTSRTLAEVFSEFGTEGFNRIYRYGKPGVDTEYFLFENRQSVGRDANLPASGVAIWHIDELGDRDNPSLTYNSNHANYECTLMQADGLWDLQHGRNNGDANDLYHLNNTAPGYVNMLNLTTTPNSRWWDGTDSGLRARYFSESDTIMTFEIVPDPPKIITRSPLPSGYVGTPYSYQLMLTGSAAPFIWSILDGSLPDGLNLSTNGLISGMAVEAVTNRIFTVVVDDAADQADTNEFAISVYPARPIPFRERFEVESRLPGGWFEEVLEGTAKWNTLNGGSQKDHPKKAYEGEGNAFFGVTHTNGAVVRLVTPLIVADSEVRALRVSFWHYMEKWGDKTDQLRVLYKTSYESEWIELANYTRQVASWTLRTIDMPEVSTTLYLAFEGSGNYGYGIGIDDLRVWDPTPDYGFVTPSYLPIAVKAVPYDESIEVEGGYEPYTFEIVDGTLPDGIVMNSSGEISGTATNTEVALITVRVTDDRGDTLEREFTLEVELQREDLFYEDFEPGGRLPLSWSQEQISNSLSWVALERGAHDNYPRSAAQGQSYASLWSGLWDSPNGRAVTQITRLITPSINLGQAPLNTRLSFMHYMRAWEGRVDELRILYRTSSSAPWQLLSVFSEETPEWTRRSILLPEPTADYYLAFEGVARFGYGIGIDYIRINDFAEQPIITTPGDLPFGTTGFAYQQQLEAVGGSSDTYDWALVGTALPSGLTLSPEGLISGVPTVPALATFKVSVTDSEGLASTNRFTLRITIPGPLPFYEPFEGEGLPFGWSVEHVAGVVGNNVWTNQVGGALGTPRLSYAGERNAVFFDGLRNNRKRLITPVLNLGVDTPNTKLSFWYALPCISAGGHELRVLYKNSPDGAWAQLAHFKEYTPEWTRVELDLPNPSPTYYIAFDGNSRNSYGGGIVIDEVLVTGDVVSPHANWLNEVFTPEQLAEGLVTGLYDDPDGDGIINLFEYAFAMDPLTPDTEGMPFGWLEGGYLWYTHRESKGASDLVFDVEVCDDLATALWTTLNVSEMIRDDSNTWWQVTSRCDIPIQDAPRRFIRLKVTLP